MNNERAIITRAFVETGKDGIPGLVRYIDRLERAVLYAHRTATRRHSRLPRTQMRRALDDLAKWASWGDDYGKA